MPMNISKTLELLERRRLTTINNISGMNNSGDQINSDSAIPQKIAYRQSKIDQLEHVKMMTRKLKEAATQLEFENLEEKNH